jgi:hypothetical protein
MFENASKLAEKLATGVSRRHFLGSLGRWAGTTALAVGGVLTWVDAARANGDKTCCKYIFVSLGGGGGGPCYVCMPLGTACPPPSPPCNYFAGSSTVHGCGTCK